MDPRTGIFYAALLLIAGCIAELYVRMNGIGNNPTKVHGVVVAKKPKLSPPIALLVVAIIAAVATIPN